MFRFEDLDEKTRLLMVHELESDIASKTTFYDVRLLPDKQDLYFTFLKIALLNGTAESFSEAIKNNYLLGETETRLVKGIPVSAKISSIAHKNIGEGEFNRYYMRAVCLKAIDQGIEEVEVYRAKPVGNPRPEEPARKNAKQLLEHLRTTNISVEGSFPGPNSGRSVRIPASLRRVRSKPQDQG